MKNNIYSPPKADLETHNDEEKSELASRWARLGAAIVDALTIAPITLPLMYFTGGFDSISEGVQPSIQYSLGMALVGIVLFVIIHGRFLIKDGQTLGKKALGIKIVTIDDQTPRLSNLFKRYSFYMLLSQIPIAGPFINMANILFIFTKSKRCLHDHVGATKVVQANKLSQL